uniref:MICAL-like protein 1 n=1 Tax=Aceria tosichella TaxID=561515 RepID=A0A6G1SLE1_9ACAR
MASTGSQYPDHLNPFGSDDDEDDTVASSSTGRFSRKKQSTIVVSQAQYPDHLDPFSADDDLTESNLKQDSTCADDYDNSLNPFGIDDDEGSKPADNSDKDTKSTKAIPVDLEQDDGNPFAEEEDDDAQSETAKQQDQNVDSKSVSQDESPIIQRSPSPDLTEPPPKPLPRTKSLLKKEQAHKRRLQEQHSITDHQTNSLQSTTSSTTSSSSTTEAISHQPVTATGSFQRQKNKRLAPPVPINFKRQVSGSLDAIEEELNGIGDKLAIIDKESNICQQTLTSGDTIDEAAMDTTRSKFVELIKRRNSIVRRQKELMYKKRELKLDQLYSDIEYELRMIGNKQLSTRTKEDEQREKELLKKLVEIVEEKNDIVENLNKDTSCDSRDVEEAFRRLNISAARDSSDKKHTNNTTAQIVSKGEGCDKKGIARLSKIATLLPRGDTIKMKRKRLFKKNCDSRPVER